MTEHIVKEIVKYIGSKHKKDGDIFIPIAVDNLKLRGEFLTFTLHYLLIEPDTDKWFMVSRNIVVNVSKREWFMK